MTWGAIGGAAISTVGGALMGGGGQQSSGPTLVNSAAPFNVAGRGFGSVSGLAGNINLRPTTQQRALQQQFLQQARQGLQAPGLSEQFLGLEPVATEAAAGYLGALGAFDPYQAAEQQFNRLESILAPQREQARQAQEARLFAQGRLGSTGGGIEQGAFQQAVEQQQTQNLINAMQQAQQTQSHLAGLGTSMAGLAASIPEAQRAATLGRMQVGLQGLGGAGEIQRQLLNMAQVGSGQAQTPGAFSGQQQPSFQQGLGAGLMQAGTGMLTNSLGGLFSNPTQSSMLQSQTGYTGGTSGILSGDEWASW